MVCTGKPLFAVIGKPRAPSGFHLSLVLSSHWICFKFQMTKINGYLFANTECMHMEIGNTAVINCVKSSPSKMLILTQMSPCIAFWFPVPLSTFFHIPHSPVVTEIGWERITDTANEGLAQSIGENGSWASPWWDFPGASYLEKAQWSTQDMLDGCLRITPEELDKVVQTLCLSHCSCREAEKDGRMNSHQQLMFFFCHNLIFCSCFLHWFWHLNCAGCTPPKAEWCKPVTITAMFISV